jgi:hypothetical protein
LPCASAASPASTARRSRANSPTFCSGTGLREILADIHRVDDIVKTELREISDKFGDERRTEIQAVSGEMDIEI